MRALAITILAVAAIVVPLVGETAASAYFVAHDDGYGLTLTAAEQNAKQTLIGDYGPCYAPYTYYAYGQLADGTWWADVSAECTYFH